MGSIGTTFAGSIPALYERHLGSLLFEPYAQDMAARLRDIGAARILEIAAGTGIVTRALANALPPEVEIVATDLNQAMLDLAATKLEAANVTWRQADAQALPFENASFDAVVSQFGVMFYPDKVKGHREALRVLKPGGRYVFSVWGPLEANPGSLVVHETVTRLFPDDPPGFIAQLPFGYADPARIRSDLEQAGFENVVIETVDKVTHASSPGELAVGLCQGSPLRNEIVARVPDSLHEVTDSTVEAMEAHFGTGPCENRMQALVVTAQR